MLNSIDFWLNASRVLSVLGWKTKPTHTEIHRFSSLFLGERPADCSSRQRGKKNSRFSRWISINQPRPFVILSLYLHRSRGDGDSVRVTSGPGQVIETIPGEYSRGQPDENLQLLIRMSASSLYNLPFVFFFPLPAPPLIPSHVNDLRSSGIANLANFFSFFFY